jgi:hypothetical protein
MEFRSDRNGHHEAVQCLVRQIPAGARFLNVLLQQELAQQLCIVPATRRQQLGKLSRYLRHSPVAYRRVDAGLLRLVHLHPMLQPYDKMSAAIRIGAGCSLAKASRASTHIVAEHIVGKA